METSFKKRSSFFLIGFLVTVILVGCSGQAKTGKLEPNYAHSESGNKTQLTSHKNSDKAAKEFVDRSNANSISRGDPNLIELDLEQKCVWNPISNCEDLVFAAKAGNYSVRTEFEELAATAALLSQLLWIEAPGYAFGVSVAETDEMLYLYQNGKLVYHFLENN